MNIVYTAVRSLIAGHAAGGSYAASFAVQSSTKRRDVQKTAQRTLSGLTVTLYTRTDVLWSVQFAPVAGADLLLMTEFLDSTESGSAFTMTLNGDANPAVTVKRSDNGYTRQQSIELGSVTTDYFSFQIEVLQS